MTFEHIDLSMLEALYKDNPKRLKEITKKYADTISELIGKLEQAAKEKEKSAQKNSAHSLKTAFKYLGMEELSETSRQIEALAEKDDETIEKHVSKITEKWQQAKTEVDKFVNA
jgi:HPt (histidine-containing phosphotransfer) domain-containing protein